MKSIYADLTADVVGTYDQTKTTIQGRCISKTVNGKTVLGPPLNEFIDVITDSGQSPAGIFLSQNSRVFVLGSPAAGILPVMLYSFNFTTGAYTYTGRINLSIPNTAATTHTIRAFKVIDTGTSGWRLFFATTGSVAINGGTFEAHSIALSDFVPIGFPTIPFATGNGQKAVYFHQDPANIGVGQLQTATAGAVLDRTNNLLYVHNGVAATHQYYLYSTSTTPTYVTDAITGNSTTDVISHAGHSFVANTPIVFTALTGGAGLTVGTTYFVRNPVAGVSYELSATSGGALLNFTTDITAGTVGRAFGTSGSNFVHKTGNLPALTGTLLLTDSEDYAEPASVNPAVDGLPCAFFSTSSNAYLGRLSELTSGAVTWPSLQACNLLGTTNQITSPTATHAAWSNVLNKMVYATNTAVFVMKSFINNQIDNIFGGVNNRYLETIVNPDVVELQLASIASLDIENGWLGVSGTATVGQRGIYLADIRSNENFDYSFVVTKVLDTPQSVYKFISTLDELFEYTGSLCVYYRTSGFGSVSGGWTLMPFAEELEGITTAGEQVQFKICFDTLGLDTSIPAQIYEFILGFESLNEISDNWEFQYDDSDNGNPARVAFRLKKAYASSVPDLTFRAYDTSGTLVASHSTVANPSFFQYSTDNGANWVNLGTIPNTVGTLIRYQFSSQPGIEVRVSIKET